MLAGIELISFIKSFFKGFDLKAVKCLPQQHKTNVIGEAGTCKGFPAIRRINPYEKQYFLQFGRKRLVLNEV